MLMASFAVGRAQQLIYLMQVLKCEGKIPDLADLPRQPDELQRDEDLP